LLPLARRRWRRAAALRRGRAAPGHPRPRRLARAHPSAVPRRQAAAARRRLLLRRRRVEPPAVPGLLLLHRLAPLPLPLRLRRRRERAPPRARPLPSRPRPRPRAAPDTTQHHRHHMRNSATVPTVVYEDPYAEYAEGAASYGYGSAYTYGPYGEPVAEEARPRGPPPTPPPPEASPWDFLDLFTPTPYDQFLEDYPRGMPGETADANRNLPTSSPNYANYAELRRMEGIPELEDESKLEPSTSAVVQDQNVKGNRPAPGPATNAAPPKGTSSTEVKLQSKGSPGANAEANKPLSRNDSVPSNAGSDTNSKKGGRSDAVSLNGANFGDIAGGNSSENKKKKKGVPFGENGDNIVGSSSTGKKGAAVDEAGSIVDADGAGGSHGKSVRSAMTVSSESFSPLHNGERDVVEAMEEVKERFEEALHCGDEVSRMLEVGKVPHRTAPKVLRCG
uniref:Uncharacterized protein n=2 Tax=Aegilops tauschii subsp. strangulata TaxID=200361 RepID=A0A453GS80_AEGTS